MRLPVSRLTLLLVAVVAALGLSAASADDATAPASAAVPPFTWNNPVVQSEFADPSAILVDGVYWATATSTKRTPGLPLLRSNDLRHWEYQGAVFPQRPRWTRGPLWAPELVATPAGLRLYYSGYRRNGGGWCVGGASAPSPAGPYTDHGPIVCQPNGSIDPTFVIDRYKRPFLVWKEDGNAFGRPSKIWAQRLRPDALGLIGRPHELLRNVSRWEGGVVEAPEIVERDGWLYMFYSGHTYGPPPHCRYALGVARARHVLGPWERHGRPILRSNRNWRCPGHISPIADATGRLFMLYHAYPALSGTAPRRLGLLDTVSWSEDGWPVINAGRGPSVNAALP